MGWEIVDKPSTQSLRCNTTLAYPSVASHLIVYQGGKVGKSLYVMPLTAAMVAYLEAQVQNAAAVPDVLAFAMLKVPLWEHEQFQPGCGLSRDDCFRLQLKLLNRRITSLQTAWNVQLAQCQEEHEQEAAHMLHLLFDSMRRKWKKRLARQQADNQALATKLDVLTDEQVALQDVLAGVMQQLSQGRHRFRESLVSSQRLQQQLEEESQQHLELTGQLQQRLAEETWQSQQLAGQLQEKQGLLDEACISSLEAHQAKEAAEAAAKLVRADLHCEQQYNANLQAKACQAEAEAKDVINRKTVEGQELQFRVGQLQELADGVRGERDVAAAEASASAQGAAERHQAQTTAERRQCEELCKQLNGQLIQERQSASNQLTQVQTQLTGRMALFEEKAGETLRLSAQVEQLTHQLNRQEQETAQAAASAAAAAAQIKADMQEQLSTAQHSSAAAIQAKETAVKELASEQDKRKALESLVQQLAQKLLEKQQTDQDMTNQLLQVQTAASDTENLLHNSSLVGTGVDEVSVQLEQSPQAELTDAAGTGHTTVQEWTDSGPSHQVGSIAAPPLIMKKTKKKCLQHALQEDSFAPSSPTIFATPPFSQVSQAESVPGCASWKGSGETAVQSSTVHSKDSIISQEKAEERSAQLQQQPVWKIAEDAVIKQQLAGLQKIRCESVKEAEALSMGLPIEQHAGEGCCTGDAQQELQTRHTHSGQAQPSFDGAVPGSIGNVPFSGPSVCTSQAQGRQVAHQHRMEGQAAYKEYRARTLSDVPEELEEPFPLHTWRFVSSEQEDRSLREYKKALGCEYPDERMWEWELAPFSPAVRFLKELPEASKVAVLGAGVNGEVRVVEILFVDGAIMPGAAKRMPYHTAQDWRKANGELAALLDGDGCPHLGQCLAVFKHRDAADGKTYLWMILEYVEGGDVNEAKRRLIDVWQFHHDAERQFLLAIKQLIQYVLEGMVWLAKRGRAHCDVKIDNIRVKVGDDGTICGLKVIDLGGSIKYKGRRRYLPDSAGCTFHMSSPEFASSDPDEHIDACAQDVYGVGLLLLMLSMGYNPPVADRSLHKLRQSHREWAAVYDLPHDDVQRLHHPIMQALSCTSEADETGAMSNLILHMLHPDCTQRATAQEALTSGVF